MRREREIDEFITDLGCAKTPDAKSANIYRNQIQKDNLKRWMLMFECDAPAPLFVGEAPGINGARITGIPFTSPELLTSSSDPWDAFAADNCFAIPLGENRSQREATATLFWKSVIEWCSGLPRPMTWNAFPFWPHDGEQRGNRTPTVAELRIGSQWLQRMVELHPNAVIVGVGRCAERALKAINVGHIPIRHPAHGGAREFAEGLRRLAVTMRG